MRIAVLAVLAVAAAAAQDRTGTIEGTVTDSVTGQPVRRAQVGLTYMGPLPGEAFRTAPEQKTAATDATGRFLFRDIVPGQWLVQAGHPRYPQRRGTPERVRLEPGGAARVAFALTPGATISGRIVDPDGDPVAECHVQVRAAGGLPHVPVMTGGSEPSDADGIYRVWGISPGKVIVETQCPPPPQPRPFSPMNVQPAMTVSFHVGRHPETIELTPGLDRTGVDFRMQLTPVYAVRGAVSAPPGALPPGQQPSVVLMASGGADGSGRAFGAPVVPGTNRFEMQGVLPGSYVLLASFNGPGVPLYAQVPVQVVDRAVDVELQLRAGATIPGRIELAETAEFDFRQVHVAFEPAQPSMIPPPQIAGVKEDGTFEVTNLMPGRWKVRALAPNAYLKSLRAGGADVDGIVLDASAGMPDRVTLVLSRRTASIRGAAPPLSEVYVTTASDPATARGTLADESGQFTIGGLPPGKYHVGSGSDEQTEEVTLGEGETVTVELKPRRK